MNRDNLFKPYEGDEDYIFISYKHEDVDTVSKIICDLNERGYRIWYDEGLHGGKNFVDEIAQRIINCGVFFSFLSKNYITSDYCKNELHYAFTKGKTVVPIMLDDSELPPDIDFWTVKIERLYLSKLKTEGKLVERLCDWDREILAPCLKNNAAPPIPKIQKKSIWPAVIIAVIVLVLAAAGLFISGLLGGDKQGTLPADPVVTESEQATDVPTELPALPTEEQTADAAGIPSEAPAAAVPLMTQAELDAAAKKALTFLTTRLDESVPLSVYDPKGSDAEESGYVYDNAMAALAILSNTGGSSNLRSKNVKKILEALSNQIADNTLQISASRSKDLAAFAIALLKADKNEKSTSFVMTAQKVLDLIIEKRSSNEGGFTSDDASESRSTADNLWLYSAFLMAEERTKNKSYQDAARSAEAYVQSMRSADGTYYLSGDIKNDTVSAEVQALAALIMNDRTGIQKASAAAAQSGCFSPDDTVRGCSMEATELMGLAYHCLGLEDEAARALSAAGRVQLKNGSIPEASAQITDGTGTHYTALPKTSVTAWFALAEAGVDPFIY